VHGLVPALSPGVRSLGAGATGLRVKKGLAFEEGVAFLVSAVSSGVAAPNNPMLKGLGRDSWPA
jgi:hypothetical protein